MAGASIKPMAMGAVALKICSLVMTFFSHLPAGHPLGFTEGVPGGFLLAFSFAITAKPGSFWRPP
jgi:hypothetical protein